MIKQRKPRAAKQFASLHCARLEFFDPEARQVFVAGSFNDWSPTATPMTSEGGGCWCKDLTLPPGRYEYRIVADGQWIDDPKAKEFISNPHGGRNAMLVIEAN